MDITASQTQQSAELARPLRQIILVDAHQRRRVVRHDGHSRLYDRAAMTWDPRDRLLHLGDQGRHRTGLTGIPHGQMQGNDKAGSWLRDDTGFAANLTSWAPERIDALRRALKGEFDGFTGEPQPVCALIFAVLYTLKQLAEGVRLLQVLDSTRWAKLVLFLIVARVAAQGSRLSAVRRATQHSVAETLGLKRFDEECGIWGVRTCLG